MAEGTCDYKRLEGMFKECELKRDKDLARIEGNLAKVEGRVDAAFEEIKTLINGMTMQNNELRSQMSNPEERTNRVSVLGNPLGVQGEFFDPSMNGHSFRYATKLEFPRFNEEGVDEWLFKIEQFFLLDKTLEHSKISVVALHLNGCALHWHKNYLKMKGRLPTWVDYVVAMKGRFGPLAYEDPMAEIKKLK